MVTDLLNDVFDGLATSRPPERLTDERRGRAHANAPLEDPRLEGRAIGNSSGWRAVLEAARRVGSTETMSFAMFSSAPRLFARMD